MFEVLKPFNTRQRRFAPGAEPVTAKTDLAPHALADLQARGFVASAPPKATEKTKKPTTKTA